MIMKHLNQLDAMFYGIAQIFYYIEGDTKWNRI